MKTITEKRVGALNRLEAQLSSGVKMLENDEVSLTDKQRERIKKEITILKERIPKSELS